MLCLLKELLVHIKASHTVPKQEYSGYKFQSETHKTLKDGRKFNKKISNYC